MGMLEGFSESAPRHGFQGCKTRASSRSCGFTAHHPIFGPSRAGEDSGTPTALQRRTSRESVGRRVRPGPTIAGGSERAKCAQRTCGGSQAPRAIYKLPEGEATGRAAPRLLAAC